MSGTWAIIVLNFYVQAMPMTTIHGFSSEATCREAAAQIEQQTARWSSSRFRLWCVEVR